MTLDLYAKVWIADKYEIDVLIKLSTSKQSEKTPDYTHAVRRYIKQSLSALGKQHQRRASYRSAAIPLGYQPQSVPAQGDFHAEAYLP